MSHNLPYNTEQMAIRSPRTLPDGLQNEPSSTKLIWLYLRPQGEVTYSRRHLTELLGMPLSSVQIAFNRLDELGLLEYHSEPRPRTKRHYSVRAAPREEAPRERV